MPHDPAKPCGCDTLGDLARRLVLGAKTGDLVTLTEADVAKLARLGNVSAVAAPAHVRVTYADGGVVEQVATVAFPPGQVAKVEVV